MFGLRGARLTSAHSSACFSLVNVRNLKTLPFRNVKTSVTRPSRHSISCFSLTRTWMNAMILSPATTNRWDSQAPSAQVARVCELLLHRRGAAIGPAWGKTRRLNALNLRVEYLDRRRNVAAVERGIEFPHRFCLSHKSGFRLAHVSFLSRSEPKPKWPGKDKRRSTGFARGVTWFFRARAPRRRTPHASSS